MRIRINPEKCVDCGECEAACPRQLRRKEFLSGKCDLCGGENSAKCAEACAYNAITVQLTDEEEAFARSVLGWKKLKEGYASGVNDFGFEEIKLLDCVLRVFRDEAEKYDESLVEEIIHDYCSVHKISLEEEQLEKIISYVRNEVTGFSLLHSLISDCELEEISIIGKNLFVYHKKRGWLEADLTITNPEKVRDIANKIARPLGRRITLKNPRLNANLPFGRMHAVIPPVSEEACVTIRKFEKKPFTARDLIDSNTLTQQAVEFLKLAMNADLSILVCGNTGSGKTTTLNVLFEFVPANERVVVVEETPEISVTHSQLVKIRTVDELDISMSELVNDTLRMRPDRVIVGEVRSKNELSALINTMLAGQGKASYATFHANNSQEALIRMQAMGVSPADLHAFDLIIVQKRWTKDEKNVRRVTEISCLKKDYSQQPEIEKIFEYSYEKDALELLSLKNSACGKIRKIMGISEKKLEKMVA